jgi:hypothetical protein
VCNGTGKVEVWEDWSLGFGEDKVRPSDYEPVKLGKPVVKIKREGETTCRKKARK